jgi:hypothetical protein
MFDLHTTVHHHLEAGLLGFAGRVRFFQPLLHPHHLGSHSDGVSHDLRDGINDAEDVDDFHREGDVPEPGVAPFPQYLLAAGIDRYNAVAMLLKILSHPIAGPVGPVGQPHHRHHPVVLQDLGDLRRTGLNF